MPRFNRNGVQIHVLATLVCLGLMQYGLAQSDPGYTNPRTHWGAPDLQGVWSIATQTTLERHARYEGKLVLNPE